MRKKQRVITEEAFKKAHKAESVVSFVNCNLSGLNFKGLNLVGSSFRDCNLSGCVFEGAILDYCDFQGASLRGADLDGARTINAKFNGADLRGAYLAGAKLSNSDIYSFCFGRHLAFLHEGYLQIGCKGFLIDDWLCSYKELAHNYGYSVLETNTYFSLINFCRNLRQPIGDQYAKTPNAK